MSGLVNGLQNRLRRFESARDLKKDIKHLLDVFFVVYNAYWSIDESTPFLK